MAIRARNTGSKSVNILGSEQIIEDEMRTSYVTVIPYSDQWERDFLKIKDEIKSVLGELAKSIEHVGSTSVRGLSTKPVIDIDVVISDSSVLNDVIAALGRIGYQHEGDLGITGREAFRYDGKDHLQKHHLYVCPSDSAELKRHLAFRDYLRSHPDAVSEYGRLKEDGAKLHPDDVDKYIEHKSPFIEKTLKRIGV